MRLQMIVVVVLTVAMAVSCSPKRETSTGSSGRAVVESAEIGADHNVLGATRHETYQIPLNTETLAIIASPGTTFSNIMGLNQLRNVRKLILNGISEVDPLATKLPQDIETFDRLEVLDLAGCTFSNLGFVNGFKNLRTLILGDSQVTNTHTFDFIELRNLESVWFVGLQIQGQAQIKNGVYEPATDPLPFDATFGPSLKVLYVSSDQFPLLFADDFFNKNSKIPLIFVSEDSFRAGRNAVKVSDFSNVHFVRARDASDTKPFLMPGQFYSDIVGDWDSYAAIR